MPLAFTIDLRDTATPALQRLGEAVQRPAIRKVMGRAVANSLSRHLRSLDRSRANQLGGARSHFYAEAASSVSQPELVGGDAVKVSITHRGLAQRYYGGDIVAGQNGSGKKFLTLPVHPAAYGHRAREFADLQLIPTRRGAILAKPNKASPNGIGEVFYALVRRVHQEPDPTVLPPEAELKSAALAAGEAHLATLNARSA